MVAALISVKVNFLKTFDKSFAVKFKHYGIRGGLLFGPVIFYVADYKEL